MKQAIVIATTPSTYNWLNNLLSTLEGYHEYPIIVLSDYKYELGKINWVMEHTDYDEFFLLQDTCEVVDHSIFDMAFNQFKGRSVAVDPTFKSYIGKYRREVLSKMVVPIATSKAEAVTYEEDFNFAYLAKDPTTVHLTNDFCHSDTYLEKFDRLNMVIECPWLRKYKHIWNRDMIREN